MNSQPNVSVIIPIYNGEKYLRECLDSVVNQTMKNIEIICVDDGSTDATASILQEYKKKDDRISIITNSENKTASISRKEGVQQAAGKYIWFVDGDDFVELDSCDKLCSIMEEKNADILQFNTRIISEQKIEEARREGYEKFLRPYNGHLQGRDVFRGCFERKQFGFTIWNKWFTAELCKKAFSYYEDISLPIAQDEYACFLLTYFAESYYGLPEMTFYSYRLGSGNTGKTRLTGELFHRYCQMGSVADAIGRFLNGQPKEEGMEATLRATRKQLLTSCVGEWDLRCRLEDKASGFDDMLAYWKPEEVVAEIAARNWYKKVSVAELLQNAKTLTDNPRKVKRIGVYYHHLSIGGAQRVVAQLIKLWNEMGYECVLITDTPPGQYDYPIPEEVEREIIFSYFETNENNYEKRAQDLARIIKKYNLDTIVYHSWMANCLLWDLLVIKSYGVNTIVHTHGVFSMMLHAIPIYWGEMPAILRLADGIVTLGKADKYFWSNFNSRVFSVINPIFVDVNQVPDASLTGKNIVWIGRVSDEKRPYDAIHILAEVLKEVPEAKLFIIGDSDSNKAYISDLKKRTEDIGVGNAVVLTGFQTDVQPFYLLGSVFLMTSKYEGFSLTLFESKAAGVPCVMYELPYLTLTENNRGIISVPMGDVKAAADAIIHLLEDDELRHRMGREAKDHAIEIGRFSYSQAWKEIFDSMETEPQGTAIPDEARIMWETLFDHYRIGATAKAQEIIQLRNNLNATSVVVDIKQPDSLVDYQKEVDLIHSSASYKIGRFMTWPARKIRTFIRCRKEHGAKYTFRVYFLREKP